MHDGQPQPVSWSRAYFAVVVNQLLVTLLLAAFSCVLAWGMRRLYVELEFDLPINSQLVLHRLGPLGIFGTACLALLATSVAAFWRTSAVGTVIASAIFTATATWLIFCIFWSIVPLTSAMGHTVSR